MNNLIKIGKIVGIFGLKGEIKVSSEVLHFDKFTNIKDLKIINAKRKKNDLWIIKVENINDANVAEKVIGMELFAEKLNFPEKKNNEYYEFEAIGMSVVEHGNENEILGKIERIMNFPTCNLIIVKLKKSINRGNVIKDELFIDTRDIMNIENDIIKINPLNEVISVD